MTFYMVILKYYRCMHNCMKSLPPGTVKQDIVRYLLRRYRGSSTEYFHIERTIGDVQRMLRRKYPEIYGRSKNLTMIHRHMDQLISEGLIEEHKENFEVHYRATSEGVRYAVNGIYGEIEAASKVYGELQGSVAYVKFLESQGLGLKATVKDPKATLEDGQWVVPLKLVPDYLEPLKKK